MKSEYIHAINTLVPVESLLAKYYDIYVGHSPVFRCPFPAHGSADQHKSAKFWAPSNCVWCFAEQRRYSAYDILQLQGYTDEVLLEFLAQHIDDVGAASVRSAPREIPASMVEASRAFRMTGEFAKLKEEIRAYLWEDTGEVADEGDS